MLIDPSKFIGTEGITHLCTGGESPMLKTHLDAVQRFSEDKLLGEEGRRLMEEVSLGCKEKVGRLFGVQANDIAFLTSTSEAINLLVYALDWNPGDNVVVADVEFPSDVLPWTLLKEQGVDLKIVDNNNWHIDLDALDKAIDENTIILAENMDLLATENSINVYNSVLLDHPSGKLQADKINYNFETKYFKVSMFDDKSIKMKVIQ